MTLHYVIQNDGARDLVLPLLGARLALFPGRAIFGCKKNSTASFIQNPSVLRQLVYDLFKLTHVSHEDHIAH